jgi:hypothetical protein
MTDGFVEQGVVVDLQHHEVMFGDAELVEVRQVDVVKLAAAASRHEVANPVLGCHSLVQMLVAGKHDVDVIADQRWLERRPDLVAGLLRMLA